MGVDPKELAAWAAKYAKKGSKAAVKVEESRPVKPTAHTNPWSSNPREWGPVPFEQATSGAAWGPGRFDPDVLVKPGPNPYAEKMAGVPELFPDMTGGANAMDGTVSPETAKALQGAMGQGANATVRDAQGRVMGQLAGDGGPLIHPDGIKGFSQPVSQQPIVPLAQIVGASSVPPPTPPDPKAN